MNTAVPGTRYTLDFSTPSRNKPMGMVPSANREFKSARPRFHVSINTNSTTPNAIGTHPPFTSLTTLALKNARSTIRNTDDRAAACHHVQPKRIRATR